MQTQNAPNYPSHLYGVANPVLWGSILQRLDYMISHHARVMYIRFDLHFPSSITVDRPGYIFSGFMGSFIKNLRHSGLSPQYIWAQEKHPDAVQPHFHIVLFISARNVRGPYNILASAKELWNRWLGGNGSGCVHECRNTRKWGLKNGTIIDRSSPDFHSVYNEVLHWAAYIAKADTKSGSIKHGRSFGASQLISCL